MKGVHFVTDPDGKAVAVQLDLEEWGEVWEDIYDAVLLEQRRSEAMTPWNEVKQELGRDTGE